MRRASSRLWVAITAPSPSSCDQPEKFGDGRGPPCADRDCRSARRPAARADALASARAMATRCCSPPESCAGRWSSRSSSPTIARAASWRARRGLLARQRRRSAAASRRSPAPRIPAADDGTDRRSRCALRRMPVRASSASVPQSRPSMIHLAGVGRARAGRRCAAATTCRRPTGRPARRSRPARTTRSAPLEDVELAAALGIVRSTLRSSRTVSSAPASSFVAQRLHRIEPGGAPGGIERRQEGQRQRHHDDDDGLAGIHLAPAAG